MGAIKLPKEFLPGFSGTEKPRAPARIDWSDPLSHGLSHYFLFDGNSIVDLVSGEIATRNGAVWTPDAMSFDEVNDYITVPNVTINGRATILSHPNFTDNAGSNFQYWFSFGSFGDFNSINVYLNEDSASGANILNVRLRNATTHKITGYFPSLNNLPYALTGIDNGGTDSTLRQYVDGIRRDDDDPVSRWPVDGTTRTLYIGAREDLNADRFFGGTLSYLAIYNSRALSPAEIAAFHRNPYRILRPASDLYYFIGTAAGGGTEVEVPTGSISYTGQSPTVTVSENITVTVPVGSLSYTGQAPTVSVGDDVSVGVPAGSLTYTGYAPAAGSSVTITVPVGSVSYSGFAPTVTAGTTVEVPTGSISYTGQAPTVSTTDNITVEVPVGSLSYTGFAPTATVTSSVNITVPVGSITYTGLAPSVVALSGAVSSLEFSKPLSTALEFSSPLGGDLTFSGTLH